VNYVEGAEFLPAGLPSASTEERALMQLVLSKMFVHETVTSQLAYFLNGGHILQLRRSDESCEIIDHLFYILHDNVNRMRN
jgi:hypothetical protein